MDTTVASADAETAARAWVEGFAAGWRRPGGAEAFAAHFRPMLAPNVRMHQPQLPTIEGHRAFEEDFVKPLFAWMPDLRGEVERWGSRGDALYIELTLHGTLAGRPISWRVCDRITLRDGVAIERESYFDPSPLLAAVLRTPRAWPGFLRLQARSVLANITRRRPR
ncbi:MAG TPA: nuclear transport factor 2 family protein [Solirubrobacteraceae bacterium]|nr:nuclear transport factor 2 family protein [Solirubrobacteraceae bacterium]